MAVTRQTEREREKDHSNRVILHSNLIVIYKHLCVIMRTIDNYCEAVKSVVIRCTELCVRPMCA